MAVAAFLPPLLFVVIAGSVGFRLVKLWRATHGSFVRAGAGHV